MKNIKKITNQKKININNFKLIYMIGFGGFSKVFLGTIFIFSTKFINIITISIKNYRKKFHYRK